MTRSNQSTVAVIGRLLLAVFLVSAVVTTISDFSGRVGTLENQGLPMSQALVVLAVVIQATGAVSLLLGFATRPVALGMAIWMGLALVVRLVLEWELGSLTSAAVYGEAGRDLAVLGGFLLLAAHGAGDWSVDERRHPRVSLGDSNVLG